MAARKAKKSQPEKPKKKSKSKKRSHEGTHAAGITPKKESKKKARPKKRTKGKVTAPRLKPGSRAGTRKGKDGRPEFKPTAEQRGQVKTMAGLGIKQVDIAALTVNPETGNGISTATLHKTFKTELGSARARQIAKVGANLYDIACDREGGGPTVTAAIFFLKSRAGWTEKLEIEHKTESGVLVVPATMTPDEWVAEQQRRNADKLPPEAAAELSTGNVTTR